MFRNLKLCNNRQNFSNSVAIMVLKAVLRIRIYYYADPDPDPRIQKMSIWIRTLGGKEKEEKLNQKNFN